MCHRGVVFGAGTRQLRHPVSFSHRLLAAVLALWLPADRWGRGIRTRPGAGARTIGTTFILCRVSCTTYEELKVPRHHHLDRDHVGAQRPHSRTNRMFFDAAASALGTLPPGSSFVYDAINVLRYTL